MTELKVGQVVKVASANGKDQEPYMGCTGLVLYSLNIEHDFGGYMVKFFDGNEVFFWKQRLEAVGPVQGSIFTVSAYDPFLPNVNSNPCSCDLFTVILRVGCQCGGK